MLEAARPILPRGVANPQPGAIATLAAFDGQAAALREALGLALPETPSWVDTSLGRVLWFGPARWIVLSDDAALPAHLAARAAGLAAVTDQTSGRVVLRLQTASPRSVLEKLVPIDLDPRVFGDRAVALTLAGHINVQLWRDGETFELSCLRSYAPSLAEALATAGA